MPDCKMWTLCIDDDANNRTVLKLTRSEYLIGRAEGSNIRLTERNVSRRHAQLTAHNERWLLTDLQSDNGCFVNGRRIAEPILLAHGDFIQIGDYRLRITDDATVRTQPDVEDDTLRAVPDGARHDQQDRLVVLTGPNTGAVYALHEGQILIGRGEECEIALTDTSVSRVHAEIVGGEHGYELFDRGSANGMHVNGVELSQTFLEPSDVIELGDVLLKFVPRGEMFIGPPPANAAQASLGLERNGLLGTSDDSFNPASFAPSSAPFSEVSPALSKNRVIFVASALLLGAVLLTFAAMHRHPAEAPPPLRAAAPSPATLVVQEAKRLFSEGNLTQAHEKLREIPADSNLRQTPEVMNMERDWAEAIFQMVASEPDVGNKRLLLREIAATEGINSEQRKRAAAQLQSLEAPSVEVNQLPVENPPEALPAQPVAASPPIRKAPAPKRPIAKEPDTPAPSPPVAPPPPKEDGLIRKLPF
jgi:pSer/pThr/pTyr-binding forkhead associated (FHA) protein